MSDLLIAPAYAEISALKRHFQLLNGSPEALQYLLASTPTPTGAELQTWLGIPANLTAFQQLISSPAGAAAVAASSTAMAAVIASSAAMAAVAASSTAMAAVAASSTAMAAVIASSAAMTTVAASSTAMTAVLNSAAARKALHDRSTAWSAVVSSATAKSALLSASVEHSTNSTTHTYPPGSGAGARVAFLQQSRVGSGISFAGSSTDSYSTNISGYVDRYVSMTGLTHRINDSRFASIIKYVIME